MQLFQMDAKSTGYLKLGERVTKQTIYNNSLNRQKGLIINKNNDMLLTYFVNVVVMLNMDLSKFRRTIDMNEVD